MVTQQSPNQMQNISTSGKIQKQGGNLVSLIDSCHTQAGANTKLARLLCKASIESPTQECRPEKGRTLKSVIDQNTIMEHLFFASERRPDSSFRTFCSGSSHDRNSLPGKTIVRIISTSSMRTCAMRRQ